MLGAHKTRHVLSAVGDLREPDLQDLGHVKPWCRRPHPVPGLLPGDRPHGPPPSVGAGGGDEAQSCTCAVISGSPWPPRTRIDFWVTVGAPHTQRFLGHRGCLRTCRTGWLGSCGRGHLHRCGDRVSAEPVCRGHRKECAELQGRGAGCRLPGPCETPLTRQRASAEQRPRVRQCTWPQHRPLRPPCRWGDGDRATGRRKMTRSNTCSGGDERPRGEQVAAWGAWGRMPSPAAVRRRRL